jgi:hypothetical protein
MSKIMSLNDDKFILGCKTRKEILNDVETRFVQKLFSGMIWITAMILLIILSSTDLQRYVFLMIIISWVISVLLFLMGNRCPFCDSLKGYEHYKLGIFEIRKGSFRCNKCNFSSNQIKELIEMLERGVEINAESTARFNKREI